MSDVDEAIIAKARQLFAMIEGDPEWTQAIAAACLHIARYGWRETRPEPSRDLVLREAVVAGVESCHDNIYNFTDRTFAAGYRAGLRDALAAIRSLPASGEGIEVARGVYDHEFETINDATVKRWLVAESAEVSIDGLGGRLVDVVHAHQYDQAIARAEAAEQRVHTLEQDNGDLYEAKYQLAAQLERVRKLPRNHAWYSFGRWDKTTPGELTVVAAGIDAALACRYDRRDNTRSK